MTQAASSALTVTFAGSGDAFGSGGRYQACIHLRPEGGDPVLLDCGATSLSALNKPGLGPGEIAAVFTSHLHGDHFGGLPLLILDGRFARRTRPLAVVGPPGTAQRLADTMECLFPGSSTTARRFGVDVTELVPRTSAAVCGTTARAWEADHPSGAPALILRLSLAGKTIAYTGDTAWTGAIATPPRTPTCSSPRAATGIRTSLTTCASPTSTPTGTGSHLGESSSPTCPPTCSTAHPASHSSLPATG
jgi:ribonuclease BN (tRNA processing enzyme)